MPTAAAAGSHHRIGDHHLPEPAPGDRPVPGSPLPPEHRPPAPPAHAGCHTRTTVPGDLLVRELPDPMTSNRRSETGLEPPPHQPVRPSAPHNCARDVRVGMKQPLPRCHTGSTASRSAIFAQHTGASETDLPPLEDRPEIEEDDVIVSDRQIRRIRPVRLERGAPGTDDPLVPAPARAEHLVRQVPNPVPDLRFGSARGDQTPHEAGTNRRLQNWETVIVTRGTTATVCDTSSPNDAASFAALTVVTETGGPDLFGDVLAIPYGGRGDRGRS